MKVEAKTSGRMRNTEADIYDNWMTDLYAGASHPQYGTLQLGKFSSRSWTRTDSFAYPLGLSSPWAESGAGYGVYPEAIRYGTKEFEIPIGKIRFEASYAQADDRKPLISRYRVVDVARKVVGVGRVGARCWIILLNGNGPEDPLFLQYKEAQASVLAPYVNAPAWECEGQRVVTGQRIIQGAPDIFLGWGKVGDKHFYVRQLRDMNFFRSNAVTKFEAYYVKKGFLDRTASFAGRYTKAAEYFNKAKEIFAENKQYEALFDRLPEPGQDLCDAEPAAGGVRCL